MNFNLSEWALKNKGLVLYFMILLGLIGIVSYSQLSQSEDPPFTFKVMDSLQVLVCFQYSHQAAHQKSMNPCARSLAMHLTTRLCTW